MVASNLLLCYAMLRPVLRPEARPGRAIRTRRAIGLPYGDRGNESHGATPARRAARSIHHII